MTDETGTNEDWRASLPEQWRDAPFIGKATSPDDALQQITNAANYMGNAIRLPGPDAGADDLAAFRAKIIEKDSELMVKPNRDDAEALELVYKSLGKPGQPDGYSKFQEMPNKPDDEVLKVMHEAAMEANLTAAQFENFVGKMLNGEHEQAQIAAQQRLEHEKGLREEWAGAFESRLADARRAAELTGAPDGIRAALADGNLDPSLAKHYAEIAKTIGGEGQQGRAQGKDTERPLDKTEILARIDEIGQRLFHDRTTTPAQKDLLNKQRIDYFTQLSKIG